MVYLPLPLTSPLPSPLLNFLNLSCTEQRLCQRSLERGCSFGSQRRINPGVRRMESLPCASRCCPQSPTNDFLSAAPMTALSPPHPPPPLVVLLCCGLFACVFFTLVCPHFLSFPPFFSTSYSLQEYKDVPMDIAQLPNLPEKASESSETSDSESDFKDNSGTVSPVPVTQTAQLLMTVWPFFHILQQHTTHMPYGNAAFTKYPPPTAVQGANSLIGSRVESTGISGRWLPELGEDFVFFFSSSPGDT